MFGTIFVMRPKPGQEQTLKELGQRSLREFAPKVEGFVAEYVIQSKTKPGEYLGIVIFDSEASYLKNANNPEQDQWYQQMRALLETDPEWNDGSVVAVYPEVGAL